MLNRGTAKGSANDECVIGCCVASKRRVRDVVDDKLVSR